MRFRIDSWPTRPRTLRRLLATDTPITPKIIDDFGSAAKGLPAIGWLLSEPDALIAEPRRRELLHALIHVLKADWNTITAQWDTVEPARYRDLVAATGIDILPEASDQESLDAVVNRLLTVLHRCEREQLAKPAGIEAGKGPRPQQVESPHTKRGAADLYANISA